MLTRAIAHRRVESPQHYPDNDLVRVTTVAAWVADLPPYGIACHALGEGKRGPSGPSAPVVVERDAMRNDRLAVHVFDDGRVSLETIVGRRRIDSLIAFQDQADVGDLYTAAPRERTFRVEYRGCRRLDSGPLRGTLELAYRIIGERRADRIADVVVRLVLDADASFLKLQLDGENHARDHRLRLRVSSGISRPRVWADAAFGPVRREQLQLSFEETRAEQVVPTAPLHRYLSLYDDEQGLTLYSDGLAEYESLDDGTIAVTLVRAVGELSRNDLPERPGHAGWPAPTPAAQCLGPFQANFAVHLHGPRTLFARHVGRARAEEERRSGDHGHVRESESEHGRQADGLPGSSQSTVGPPEHGRVIGRQLSRDDQAVPGRTERG